MRHFIILFFLITTQYLSAQIDQYDIQFPYKSYAKNLYENDNGEIWLYNNENFLRYDGETFTAKNIYGHITIKDDAINDANGVVYIKNDSVFHYYGQTKVTTHIETLDSGSQFDFFYKDDANTVWIFTQNLEKKEQNVYKITEDDTLEFAFNIYEYLGGHSINENIELEDVDGYFYFHLAYGRLLIIDSKGNKVDLPLAASETHKIEDPCSVFRLDNKNNLWRITYDAFEIYNPKLKTFEAHPISNKVIVKNECKKISGVNLALNQIFIDSEDRIWLGFEDSNLFMYDESDDTFINFKTPLIKVLEGKSGDIKTLMEDRNGNIWGNKRGGIFKIRKKENGFKSYLVDTNNPDHQLYKLNPEHSKQIWSYFGKEYLNTYSTSPQITSNGDLYSQDQRFSYRILAKNDSLEVIPWLHTSQKQYLHFINDSLRIYTTWNNYYRIDQSLKTTLIPNPVDLPLRSLNHVFKQKNGVIWASGLLYPRGTFLAQLNPKTLRIENVLKKVDKTLDFSDNFIVKLDEDEQSNLWISSYDGLYKMNEKLEVEKMPEYHFFDKDSIQFNERITFFNYSGNNTGWLYNKNQIGFLNLNTNQLKYYVTKEDLNLIEITDVLHVDNHSIWYSSRTGIGFYDFKTKAIKHFDETYTIIDDFFAKSLKLNPLTGEIIATSSNGLHIFHPDSLLKLYDAKKIVNENVNLSLTDYSILYNKNKDITTFYPINHNGEAITLNYNDKLVTLNFELIHYSYPKRHRFKYKLVGYDDEWSQQTSKSDITYMSLPPGDYTLRIKGSIDGHLWSTNELAVSIHVKQAWFRTGWFYLLIVSFLSLVTYGLTRYYYKLKLKQKTEIDALRTKISIDLHDDVGSILTGMSMQSEILEKKANKEDKAVLHRISELSRSAMLRMRDAVWAMDSRKNIWESLLDRMHEFASETLELKSIDYQIKYNAINLDKNIPSLVRQNLYLIYKEAMTNIIKHSNADAVLIDLQEHKDRIKLIIKDNGSVTRKFSTSGLGLSNMKHRAQQIHCDFEIIQDPGFTIVVKSKGSM